MPGCNDALSSIHCGERAEMKVGKNQRRRKGRPRRRRRRRMWKERKREREKGIWYAKRNGESKRRRREYDLPLVVLSMKVHILSQTLPILIIFNILP